MAVNGGWLMAGDKMYNDVARKLTTLFSVGGSRLSIFWVGRSRISVKKIRSSRHDNFVVLMACGENIYQISAHFGALKGRKSYGIVWFDS